MISQYTVEPYKKATDAIKSPLRYPGGKFYALKHIMPYIVCVPHDEYREPFMGGGSVFFAKKKVKYNIINDLETEIIDLYRWIQDAERCEQLIEMLSREEATRERHAIIKELVAETEIEKVFKTYYLNRTSYSGIINRPAWGYAEGKSSPPKNWGNFLRTASKKLVDVEMFSLDFTEILNMPPKGRDVLVYLDPPYYHADQKRAYTKPFEIEDHIRVAHALRNTKYNFCLSYDDCPEIRELYSWANINDVSWLYNTDNKPGQSRKACKEVIITNYETKHINSIV